MRIGILTGGGDVPGLNVAIKSVVEAALARGWSVTGFKRGWLGPLAIDPADPETIEDWTVALDRDSVRGIDRDGGTILHTSRLAPQKLPKALAPARLLPHFADDAPIDATRFALATLQALNIDVVVPLGGDGTLRFAARLSQEGVPVVSIPKTMDNDVHGTDYAIGFSTAVTRSVDAIAALRSTAGSHERIMVVELFGRHSGQTALYAGLLADADRTIIAESPFDLDDLARTLEADRLANPLRYSVCVVSEGARPKDGRLSEQAGADAYGRKRLGGVGDLIAEACTRESAEGVIVQRLAYLMRSGPPDATDRLIALGFGRLAVELIEARAFGKMCAIRGGRFEAAPVDAPLQGERRVDPDADYDASVYRARLENVTGMPLFNI
ncbi:MAG: ATP-dependent 6-phosphofructokinase [Alphaproteobacteria bacterium]|nr:ATP-dependent 6-phosphofructokinase [Alphaproteobacteria bacterium]